MYIYDFYYTIVESVQIFSENVDRVSLRVYSAMISAGLWAVLFLLMGSACIKWQKTAFKKQVDGVRSVPEYLLYREAYGGLRSLRQKDETGRHVRDDCGNCRYGCVFFFDGGGVVSLYRMRFSRQ